MGNAVKLAARNGVVVPPMEFFVGVRRGRVLVVPTGFRKILGVDGTLTLVMPVKPGEQGCRYPLEEIAIRFG